MAVFKAEQISEDKKPRRKRSDAERLRANEEEIAHLKRIQLRKGLNTRQSDRIKKLADIVASATIQTSRTS